MPSFFQWAFMAAAFIDILFVTYVQSPQRLEKSVGSPAARREGDFELPYRGPGN